MQEIYRSLAQVSPVAGSRKYTAALHGEQKVNLISLFIS
jgi:hypothetical protein